MGGLGVKKDSLLLCGLESSAVGPNCPVRTAWQVASTLLVHPPCMPSGRQAAGQLPDALLAFRDGVSESQLATVLQQEVVLLLEVYNRKRLGVRLLQRLPKLR